MRDRLAEHLDITTIAGHNAIDVALECCQLLDSKQQDYGPNNIIALGKAGVLSRIEEKVIRAKRLMQSDAEPRHETLEDTFKDIANFAIIWLLLDRELWPEKED